MFFFFFFFNDTATTEIYTLSLHDALPIYVQRAAQTVLRSAAAGQPDGQGWCADRDGAWRCPFPGCGPRPAAAVREPRRDGRGKRSVCDERPVSGRAARCRADRKSVV